MDKIIWLVLLIGFIMVEAATVTVVSVWFAFGALVALVAALLGAQIWLQAVLFFLVSGAVLCGVRPWVKKYFKPKQIRTNVDALIGTEGLVTAAIDNVHSVGQVKIGAMEWSARSSDGQKIEAGTRVRIDKVEGVKVFVTALEVKVNA